MAVDVNPLQRAFNAFLMAMPPAELEELLRYLHDHNTSTAGQAAPITEVPSIAVAPTAVASVTNGTAKSGNRNRTTAARGKRFREGKLRPLNSFIAFRSFYSAAFPQFTQKAKSGILRFLWENDPFKAKWAILAKAYSIIRDSHVGQVSLDTFLVLNCHFVGIIEPEKYLAAMGWELAMDENHQHSMVRISTTLPMEADTVDYSVNDIIEHCYETGYVKSDSGNRTIGKLDKVSLMSFATQSTVTNGFKTDASGLDTAGDLNGDTAVNSNVNVRPPSVTLENFHASGSVINEGTTSITQLFEVRDGPRNQHEFMAELDDALNGLRGPNPDDDDLFAPFNPAIESPIVHYDPLTSEPFDAFDIHELMDL
ncbi:mating-type protein MAT alpha 1 [Paecilomyces variotii No. 5]|uniref:Mating-type protein MAT alpha 1 n=1 Tax=Byssochlamys spectabilis (strain No. 5 / NBRC 109023) TaxID=1356009 RepID=V5F8D4_BYSSN|nr:mating-type protein MAT alpha 1 [Paecilomyces variotii No. 5]